MIIELRLFFKLCCVLFLIIRAFESKEITKAFVHSWQKNQNNESNDYIYRIKRTFKVLCLVFEGDEHHETAQKYGLCSDEKTRSVDKTLYHDFME